MTSPSIFFVGQPHEVAHHAAPFQSRLSVTIVGPEEVVEQTRPGDLAIFYSEHFDRFRVATQELQQRNVATLYMIDGILEWRNAWENRADEVACPYAMRPALSHKIACIGASQARVLNAWGNARKTEVVGIPRLDMAKIDSTKSDGSDRAGFRVLVMTAKTPGFTPEQMDRVRESLLDLKDWHIEHPVIDCRRDGASLGEIQSKPIEFVWRLTGGLDLDIGVENQLTDLTGKELAEVLQRVDAVVTTPSTAMLEAMQWDLPVAVLDYHNCPHYVNAGWDICSANHIGPALREMAMRCETRMLFQRTELADALHDQGDALDRFVELVNAMLKSAKEQLESCPGSPLSFPAQLLQPTTTVLAEFCHQRVYDSAPEFTIADTTVLQLELSHARREIRHLQSELAQIQSELDQAHQIFEQIENHPIAGPVVRIRQKMLDLMTAMRNRKIKLDAACAAPSVNHSNSNPESPVN